MKTVEIVLCFLFILFYFLTKKSELLIFANASFASFFHGISQNRLGKKKTLKRKMWKQKYHWQYLLYYSRCNFIEKTLAILSPIPKAFIRPFEAPQRSVKIKISVNFHFNTMSLNARGGKGQNHPWPYF